MTRALLLPAAALAALLLIGLGPVAAAPVGPAHITTTEANR